MAGNPYDPEFLSALRRKVEIALDTYVYESPVGAVGRPMRGAAIAEGLATMRASLVEPYWVEVELRDTFEQVGMTNAPKRLCAVVAEDCNGVVLLFDPVENGFVLAQTGDTGVVTFGVRGDAVDCFMAR